MEIPKDLQVEYNMLSSNKKVFSAFLFVVSLFMSNIANKTILLVHMFPSYQVLGLGQMMANVFMMWVGSKCRLIQIPPLNKRIALYILPLPLTYLGRIMAYLGTRGLAFPLVLTPLRQLNVVVTLILEKYVFNITAPFVVQSSVIAMAVGALLSTIGEPYFWSDYITVLLKNSFLAANLVYLKNMLHLKKIGMCGLVYYDYLFCILPGLIVACFTNDLDRTVGFKDLKNIFFLCHFHMSCVLRFVQSFSVVLCLEHNSALTTAVVETLTRILLCYLEILITSSYVIIWMNILGLSISILGSLVYMYATFKRKHTNIYMRVDDSKV